MEPLRTQAPGIHQSDVVIRGALVYALQDIRANPWLLRYVFASLPQDPLTAAEYGEAEAEEAANWFLTNNVPVILALRVDGKPPIPCISVALNSSAESEGTLADVHWQTSEPFNADSKGAKFLAGPYTVQYEASTGLVTFPSENRLVLSKGQVVVASSGKEYRIIRGVGREACYIEKGLVDDVSTLAVTSAPPSRIVTLESLRFDEQYMVGCHAMQPNEAIYLHSIVVFCLLRYKQRCLEARGFGESVLHSKDLQKNPYFEQVGIAEPVYSRYIAIEGNTRNYWPKDVIERTSSVVVGIGTGQSGGPDNGDVELEDEADHLDSA